MNGEGQEIFDGLTDIQDGSRVHGMLIPLSISGPQVANEFTDQRRGNTRGGHLFIQEPLLKIPNVAGGLAEAVDIELSVEEAPQKRFPRTGQMREPLGKSLRRRFKDF